MDKSPFSFTWFVRFHFTLFLLFRRNAELYRRNDERPLRPWKRKEGGWDKMEFMKAIVSDVRFTIAFID